MSPVPRAGQRVRKKEKKEKKNRKRMKNETETKRQ